MESARPFTPRPYSYGAAAEVSPPAPTFDGSLNTGQLVTGPVRAAGVIGAVLSLLWLVPWVFLGALALGAVLNPPEPDNAGKWDGFGQAIAPAFLGVAALAVALGLWSLVVSVACASGRAWARVAVAVTFGVWAGLNALWTLPFRARNVADAGMGMLFGVDTMWLGACAAVAVLASTRPAGVSAR